MTKRKKPLLDIAQLIRVVDLARFHLNNCGEADEAAELDIEAVEAALAALAVSKQDPAKGDGSSFSDGKPK